VFWIGLNKHKLKLNSVACSGIRQHKVPKSLMYMDVKLSILCEAEIIVRK